MYSNVVRSDGYIRRLLDFVRCEYGIDADDISPAKRGFYGETWKLCAADRRYFVKLVYAAEHKGVYENSFAVIDHMNNNGIDFISKVVKSVSENLSVQFDGAVIGVFDWIDGENRQDEKSKILEYQMMAKVYTVPTEGLNIQREDFSTKSAEKFMNHWALLPPDTPINALFERHRARIEHRAERLRLFSERCADDTSRFFITHGDAGGNYVEGVDRNYIVDWDTPILAPPERDAWVCMCWDWAVEGFHDALRQNGIDYILRKERLAYYCYHMFFFYLNAYLDRFKHTSETQGLEEYMSGWIEESFQYADKMP